jgi:hypothetical protein
LDFRRVEARQDIDDVQARDGVLALDARQQIVDRGLVGDFPISEMILNSAARSVGSWAYAALSSSRTVKRDFCAAITSSSAGLGMSGLFNASSSAAAG